MTNNQKILFVSGGLIILGIYFFTKQSKQDAQLAEEKSNTDEGSLTKADWDKVLKKGSIGVEVEVLQRALKQLDVDGDFGEKTEKRLKNVTGLSQVSINQYNTIIKDNTKKTAVKPQKSVFQV